MQNPSTSLLAWHHTRPRRGYFHSSMWVWEAAGITDHIHIPEYQWTDNIKPRPWTSDTRSPLSSVENILVLDHEKRYGVIDVNVWRGCTSWHWRCIKAGTQIGHKKLVERMRVLSDHGNKLRRWFILVLIHKQRHQMQTDHRRIWTLWRLESEHCVLCHRLQIRRINQHLSKHMYYDSFFALRLFSLSFFIYWFSHIK